MNGTVTCLRFGDGKFRGSSLFGVYGGMSLEPYSWFSNLGYISFVLIARTYLTELNLRLISRGRPDGAASVSVPVHCQHRHQPARILCCHVRSLQPRRRSFQHYAHPGEPAYTLLQAHTERRVLSEFIPDYCFF